MDLQTITYRRTLKERVIRLLGGNKCAKCGFDDPRALQIDHVNGGGVAEVNDLGEIKMLQKIIAVNGVGYQILCANCNWIKRYENDECHIYDKRQNRKHDESIFSLPLFSTHNDKNLP